MDLLDPKPEDMAVEDIAHALSRICRYTGHTPGHYSVAEHSLLVSRLLIRETGNLSLAYQGLMHDAPEAYVGDLSRPLKTSSPALSVALEQIESKIWGAICLRHGLNYNLSDVVHEMDTALYLVEMKAIFGEGNRYDTRYYEAARPVGLPAERAERVFLAVYRQLRQALGLEPRTP